MLEYRGTVVSRLRWYRRSRRGDVRISRDMARIEAELTRSPGWRKPQAASIEGRSQVWCSQRIDEASAAYTGRHPRRQHDLESRRTTKTENLAQYTENRVSRQEHWHLRRETETRVGIEDDGQSVHGDIWAQDLMSMEVELGSYYSVGRRTERVE
jgi:hypothetical protein